MSAVKDWAETAARVIMLKFHLKEIAPQDTSVYALANIIHEHCPMKPDVAYMPVPRCEACTRWDKSEGVAGSEVGRCAWLASETFKDFGCVQWKGKG